MIRQITEINWRYIGDVLPSFVVITFIPFSYSVAYGLIASVLPSPPLPPISLSSLPVIPQKKERRKEK